MVTMMVLLIIVTRMMRLKINDYQLSNNNHFARGSILQDELFDIDSLHVMNDCFRTIVVQNNGSKQWFKTNLKIR